METVGAVAALRPPPHGREEDRALQLLRDAMLDRNIHNIDGNRV